MRLFFDQLQLVTMPSNCVVPFCKSRNATVRFPKDATLKKKWLEAIRRDNYEPSKYSRMCRLHFLHTDFSTNSIYYSDNPVKFLKKDAIPSIFAWSNVDEDEEANVQYIFQNHEDNINLAISEEYQNNWTGPDHGFYNYFYQEPPSIDSVLQNTCDEVVKDNTITNHESKPQNVPFEEVLIAETENLQNYNNKVIEIEIFFDKPINDGPELYGGRTKKHKST